MPRPTSLLPALAAATLGLVAVVGPGTGTAEAQAPKRAEPGAPLAVTIEALTPSALPRSGPIRVSGEIVNASDQTWHAINLYPFVSDAPMTTEDELAAAVDVETAPGERITDPAPYATIEELAPGESRQYSFAVPRREIAANSVGVGQRDPGVYWFGVHALGQTGAERDTIADGRALTFLPLVPESADPIDTALVVQVRQPVRYDADGRVSDVARWTRTLSPGGRMRATTDFGVAAGDRPLSWLVDPAVVDAAVQLTEGNPARSLEPTIDPTPEEPEEPDASESPDASDSPAASEGTIPDGEESEEPDAEDEAVAAAATAASEWLGRLETGLTTSEVLSLPYGDLDLSAAAEHAPTTYDEARERSADELAPWGFPTTPAVGSAAGYLSPGALNLVGSEARILVSDRMIEGRAPAVARTDGHSLVITSSGAASGGPGPGLDEQRSLIGMRQRIVSEAAVRALAPGSRPLVVVLPADWAPQSSAGFFEGLDQPWVDLSSVGTVAQHAARDVPADRLLYPPLQRRAELDAVDFELSGALAETGDTLQNLLTLNDEVGGVVRDEALTQVGYGARRQPARTRSSAIRSRGWIEQQLRTVTVEGPRAVILASGSGRFSATLTNRLDQPVTVRLDAVTDPQLRVAVPDEPIELAPDARTTVLLNASSSTNGVRSATLQLTDVDGTPIGSPDSLPIRSNRVSNVIWLILGTGVALLFATIVIRLVRRIRAARP